MKKLAIFLMSTAALAQLQSPQAAKLQVQASVAKDFKSAELILSSMSKSSSLMVSSLVSTFVVECVESCSVNLSPKANSIIGLMPQIDQLSDNTYLISLSGSSLSQVEIAASGEAIASLSSNQELLSLRTPIGKEIPVNREPSSSIFGEDHYLKQVEFVRKVSDGDLVASSDSDLKQEVEKEEPARESFFSRMMRFFRR